MCWIVIIYGCYTIIVVLYVFSANPSLSWITLRESNIGRKIPELNGGCNGNKSIELNGGFSSTPCLITGGYWYLELFSIMVALQCAVYIYMYSMYVIDMSRVPTVTVECYWYLAFYTVVVLHGIIQYEQWHNCITRINIYIYIHLKGCW